MESYVQPVRWRAGREGEISHPKKKQLLLYTHSQNSKLQSQRHDLWNGVIIYSFSCKDIYHQDEHLTIQLVFIFSQPEIFHHSSAKTMKQGLFTGTGNLYVPPHLLGNLFITTGPSFSETPKTQTHMRGTRN